jgi:hypothetical protein
VNIVLGISKLKCEVIQENIFRTHEHSLMKEEVNIVIKILVINTSKVTVSTPAVPY